SVIYIVEKTKPKRLFKVASYFNVAIGTIQDILSSKGYEISNIPTAKLDKEMLKLIEDYFSRSFSSDAISPNSKSKSVFKRKIINDGDSKVDFEYLFQGYIY